MTSRAPSPARSNTSSPGSALGDRDESTVTKYSDKVARAWRKLGEIRAFHAKQTAEKSGSVVLRFANPKSHQGGISQIGADELTKMARMIGDAHKDIVKRAKAEYKRKSKLTPAELEVVYAALLRRAGAALQQTLGQTALTSAIYAGYSTNLEKKKGDLTRRQLSAKRLEYLTDALAAFCAQIDLSRELAAWGIDYAGAIRPLFVNQQMGSSAILMSVLSLYGKAKGLNRPDNRVALADAALAALFNAATRVTFRGSDVGSTAYNSGLLPAEDQAKLTGRLTTSAQSVLQIHGGAMIPRQGKNKTKIMSPAFDGSTISSTMYMKSLPYWLIPVSVLAAAYGTNPAQAEAVRAAVDPQTVADVASPQYGMYGNADVARGQAIMLLTQYVRDQLDEQAKAVKSVGRPTSPPRAPRSPTK